MSTQQDDYDSLVARLAASQGVSEAEIRAQHAAWAKAEEPLLAELREAGIVVESVWNLRENGPTPPAALPILVKHLGYDYPDRIMEGIALGLAVPAAARWWPELKERYINATGPDAKLGLANALIATATPKTADELVDLIKDPSNGNTRVLLLRPLKKSKTPETRRFLEGLRSDDYFGREARRLIDGKNTDLVGSRKGT